MKLTQTRGTTSTTPTAASKHSGVQGRGSSALSKALSTISNTIQKWVGNFGQKGHSSRSSDKQPIDKIEIKAVRSQNMPNKAEIKRPKEAPPAPPVPVAANASQQGPATSVQNGSEPAKSGDKMTQNEMKEAQRLITRATISFEIERRLNGLKRAE
ncbi:hypothetical protein AB8989_08255 [Yersinia hibernica]|uniref:hypothetical protein n=1 Tax=Yersinia hibernica TaxID=2339259 RepID=UPI003D01B62C